MAPETLRFLFFNNCTFENTSDDVGLVTILKNHIDYFKSKSVNVPRITALLDNIYNLDKLTRELSRIYQVIMLIALLQSRYDELSKHQTLA